MNIERKKKTEEEEMKVHKRDEKRYNDMEEVEEEDWIFSRTIQYNG